MTRTTRFDVAVVGGGAAGCVVAARLAERSSGAIALLEAGPDLGSDVPPELHDGWSLPTTDDWGYEAERDERGSVRVLRRGMLIGGTSWQTRFAMRSAPADFDGWAAAGNTGWSFDEALPWFRTLETDLEYGDAAWHGNDGPLPITRYPDLQPTEIQQAAIDAMLAAGMPVVDDHNRPGAVGVGRMPMNTRDGIRWTTADAWLAPDRRPSNLTVRGNAHVDRVELDGTRATGVRLADGTTIEASRVVLCAGTYGSPPILLRSGIGPADHLTSLAIPVRVELSGVGANLADHPEVDLDPGWRGAGRERPLLHTLATFRSRLAPPDGAPDLLFWITDPTGDEPAFSIDVVLMKPRSRGTVRLRSTDPRDPPLVVLPGLSDPTDIERLAEGYRFGLAIAKRPELRRVCSEPPPPEPDSDDAVRRLVVQERYSLPHVVGTCAMGPDPAGGAVVGLAGAVHGTRRSTSSTRL